MTAAEIYRILASRFGLSVDEANKIALNEVLVMLREDMATGPDARPLRRFEPGEEITADRLNEIIDAIEALRRSQG